MSNLIHNLVKQSALILVAIYGILVVFCNIRWTWRIVISQATFLVSLGCTLKQLQEYINLDYIYLETIYIHHHGKSLDELVDILDRAADLEVHKYPLEKKFALMDAVVENRVVVC